MNTASGAAPFIMSFVTWYPAKSLSRFADSSSWPIEILRQVRRVSPGHARHHESRENKETHQVSVVMTLAPLTASFGS